MLLRVTILTLWYESLLTGNEDQGKQQQIEQKKKTISEIVTWIK